MVTNLKLPCLQTSKYRVVGSGFGIEIWDRDLGSGFGIGIWDRDLGSGFGIGIWDPDLGSGFGIGISHLWTDFRSCF